MTDPGMAKFAEQLRKAVGPDAINSAPWQAGQQAQVERYRPAAQAAPAAGSERVKRRKLDLAATTAAQQAQTAPHHATNLLHPESTAPSADSTGRAGNEHARKPTGTNRQVAATIPRAPPRYAAGAPACQTQGMYRVSNFMTAPASVADPLAVSVQPLRQRALSSAMTLLTRGKRSAAVRPSIRPQQASRQEQPQQQLSGKLGADDGGADDEQGAAGGRKGENVPECRSAQIISHKAKMVAPQLHKPATTATAAAGIIQQPGAGCKATGGPPSALDSDGHVHNQQQPTPVLRSAGTDPRQQMQQVQQRVSQMIEHDFGVKLPTSSAWAQPQQPAVVRSANAVEKLLQEAQQAVNAELAAAQLQKHLPKHAPQQPNTQSQQQPQPRRSGSTSLATTHSSSHMHACMPSSTYHRSCASPLHRNSGTQDPRASLHAAAHTNSGQQISASHPSTDRTTSHPRNSSRSGGSSSRLHPATSSNPLIKRLLKTTLPSSMQSPQLMCDHMAREGSLSPQYQKLSRCKELFSCSPLLASAGADQAQQALDDLLRPSPERYQLRRQSRTQQLQSPRQLSTSPGLLLHMSPQQMCATVEQVLQPAQYQKPRDLSNAAWLQQEVAAGQAHSHNAWVPRGFERSGELLDDVHFGDLHHLDSPASMVHTHCQSGRQSLADSQPALMLSTASVNELLGEPLQQEQQHTLFGPSSPVVHAQQPLTDPFSSMQQVLQPVADSPSHLHNFSPGTMSHSPLQQQSPLGLPSAIMQENRRSVPSVSLSLDQSPVSFATGHTTRLDLQMLDGALHAQLPSVLQSPDPWQQQQQPEQQQCVSLLPPSSPPFAALIIQIGS